VTAGPVTVTFDAEVDAGRLPAMLSRPAGELVVDSTISVDEVFGGLALWLAINDAGFCTLDAAWPKHDAPPMPLATTFPSGDAMVGWSPATFDGSSLAALGRGSRGLAVHAYGENADCAARLGESIGKWDAAGRPGSQSVALQVLPASEPVPAGEGLVKIEKRWTNILVEWPRR
jgi:hypothetical protein